MEAIKCPECKGAGSIRTITGMDMVSLDSFMVLEEEYLRCEYCCGLGEFLPMGVEIDTGLYDPNGFQVEFLKKIAPRVCTEFLSFVRCSFEPNSPHSTSYTVYCERPRVGITMVYSDQFMRVALTDEKQLDYLRTDIIKRLRK